MNMMEHVMPTVFHPSALLTDLGTLREECSPTVWSQVEFGVCYCLKVSGPEYAQPSIILVLVQPTVPSAACGT